MCVGGGEDKGHIEEFNCHESNWMIRCFIQNDMYLGSFSQVLNTTSVIISICEKSLIIEQVFESY